MSRSRDENLKLVAAAMERLPNDALSAFVDVLYDDDSGAGQYLTTDLRPGLRLVRPQADDSPPVERGDNCA